MLLLLLLLLLVVPALPSFLQRLTDLWAARHREGSGGGTLPVVWVWEEGTPLSMFLVVLELHVAALSLRKI